jgi:hypothetical protein
MTRSAGLLTRAAPLDGDFAIAEAGVQISRVKETFFPPLSAIPSMTGNAARKYASASNATIGRHKKRDPRIAIARPRDP